MLIPFGVFSSAGAGGGGGGAGSFDLISTTLLSSSTTSVNFDVSTLAASGYKHLQIRVTARSDRSADNSTIYLGLNNDTSEIYSWHRLYGNGSIVEADSGTSVNGDAALIPAANAGSNIFGSAVIDILDPFSSAKNKTMRTFAGHYGANTWVTLWSTLWPSTSAVTTVNVKNIGYNFVAGSRFSIYGIKG